MNQSTSQQLNGFKIGWAEHCAEKHRALGKELDDLRGLMLEKFIAAEQARSLALEVQQTRFANANQWHVTVENILATVANKSDLAQLVERMGRVERWEAEASTLPIIVAANVERLGRLEKWQANLEGRMWVISFMVPIIISLVLHFLQ